MKSIDLVKLRNYFALSVVIGIFMNCLTVHNSNFHYLINALFLGGMSIVLIGMFQFVRVLGFFDLVFYSHRKLFQYSRFHKDTLEDGKEDLGSFHDYKLKHKKSMNYLEPFFVGGILTVLSIILSFADLFLLI